jgi:kynurenine formamidase
MVQQRNLPAYAQLKRNDALGGNTSWGVFGDRDDLGTVNLLTPDRVRAAAAAVRRGVFFNLSLPLNTPETPQYSSRSAYRHHIYAIDRNTQDDVLDNFYLQASSQIDSLRHIAAREFGYYNGVSASDAGPGREGLGIHRWAEHGLVGRGVLADIARQCDASSTPTDFESRTVIYPDALEACLGTQGVMLEPGDILLVRTGYLRAYFALAPSHRRVVPRAWPGLFSGEEMASYLWDHHVAMVGADNPAVEAAPGVEGAGFLHRRLIPMLGIGMAELLNLEALAEDCAADGIYSFLFAAVPLNLPGGVGSPANAFALK